MGARPVILVHGGAGVPPAASLEPAQRDAALAGLRAALHAGRAVLDGGGSAVDAVEAAVRALEDDPAFNAGIGAALTSEGHAEHDAAIMDGATLMAGGVTGTRHVRHPVSLARTLMDQGPHVFMSGPQAEALAVRRGLEMLPPAAFVTPRRQAALERVRQSEHAALLNEETQHGTVGAVALDAAGHVAAATSTGGVTNKLPGRIGDSPVIGGGTFADDRSCAISATGRGEFFLRSVFAHRVACLCEIGQLPIAQATAIALEEVRRLGGSGGVIGVTPAGETSLCFTSAGMYRGSWHLDDDTPRVSIY